LFPSFGWTRASAVFFGFLEIRKRDVESNATGKIAPFIFFPPFATPSLLNVKKGIISIYAVALDTFGPKKKREN
jgi:hypothetical protein